MLLLAGTEVPEDWDLQRGFQDATGSPWQVIQCVASRYAGLAKVTRYFKYIQMNRRSDILSYDQFFGLVLALYCRLFHLRKAPDIHAMALIYRRKRGMAGRICE